MKVRVPGTGAGRTQDGNGRPGAVRDYEIILPRDRHVDRLSLSMPRVQRWFKDNAVALNHLLRGRSRRSKIGLTLSIEMYPLNIHARHSWNRSGIGSFSGDCKREVHQMGSFRTSQGIGNYHRCVSLPQRGYEAPSTTTK